MEHRRYMKKRSSLSAAFILLALLMLPALAACDAGTPPTVTLAPTQSAADAPQLQATIEALQTTVAEQAANAPAPTPQATTEIASEPTSEPDVAGAQEPEATEVPVDAETEEPADTSQPGETPVAVALPEGPQVQLA